MGEISMNWSTSILIFLVAFMAIFLQSAYSGLRSLLGVQIDLLPGLMVYTSLTAGWPSIATFALLAGLGFDCLSQNPLGSSILPLFVIGGAIHMNRGLILRDQFYAQFILGFAANGLVPIGTLLLARTAGANPLLSWLSLWEWLLMSLFGGLLTPALFTFFEKLNRTFNYQPLQAPSFRSDREIKRGRFY